MTEIQWLVDCLLNEKMPTKVKDRFIARIGEVEALLSKPTIQAQRPISPILTQAPSTQRLLESHDMPVHAAIKPPTGPIDKETGTTIIATGNGTRGPRKF